MLKLIEHGAVTEIRVSRTVLGRPVYFNSFFYVDGLLIDTGPPHVSREVEEALRHFRVEQVVVTHPHEDHFGNCRLLRERWEVPVYAHPLTLETMANPPKIQLYRKFMWGSAPPAGGFPLGETVKTAKFQFMVIDTPGHAPGHVSLFEPSQKWLFCGDLYLGEKLTGFMEGENIADHLASLEKVISLKPELLFCGLKGKLDHGARRLAEKYRFWWELGKKVKALYQEGAAPREILHRLLGGEVPFYYLSQLNWGRKHLIDSFIAYRHLF